MIEAEQGMREAGRERAVLDRIEVGEGRGGGEGEGGGEDDADG
jgi:hypothetical protein